MLIPNIRNRRIPAPTISPNATACVYVCFYKSLKTLSRSIGNKLKANSADTLAVCRCRIFIFNRNCHQCFIFSAASPFSGTFTSNGGLIDFNDPREIITPRPYHCASQFMQSSPICMIASQPKNPLQPQIIGPVFLIGNMPHCLKPEAQGLSRPMEKSTGCHRRLARTVFALKQPSRCSSHFLFAVYRAFKSFRPAQVNEIVKHMPALSESVL